MKGQTKTDKAVNMQYFYQTTENAPSPNLVIKESFYHFLKVKLSIK